MPDPAPPEDQQADISAMLDIDPAAVVSRAETVLQLEPQNGAAFRLLAKALLKLGRPDDARNARARAVQSARYDANVVAAHKAVLADDAAQAIALLQGHLDRHPDDPVALLIMGEALSRQGRLAPAVAAFEAALDFMPEYREARLGLARVHYQRFDPRAALAALEPLIGPDSSDIALLRWQATLLMEQGDLAEAELLLHRLLKLAPNDPALLISLGDAQRTMGHTDDAEATYRKAIAARPAMGAAWWSLASLGGKRMSPADRSAIQAALRSPASPQDRLYLLFAEGTAADHAGEHEWAFTALTEANRQRRQTLQYDGAQFAQRMEALEQSLDQGFFAERADWGNPSDAPIFIVGMPRSGSTLVEQILAGHSAIEAGGEMPIITSLLRETAADMGLDPERDIVSVLTRLQPDQCRVLGDQYLRRAFDRCGTDTAHFTDKLLHNWAELAFIRLILPNARAIDIRRNALDCCVSNFALLFQPGHPASYDLAEMAEYYRTYVQHMEWVKAALPGMVLAVEYEALVDDPERITLEMLRFVDLPFEPACLAVGSGKRVIATASAEQARQPINRQGVGRWKRFEPWLEPLKEHLGALAEG